MKPAKPRKIVRNNDLAIIHIAKQQLGMDDETYRQMLWTIARVNSSADLDHAGRAKVIEFLKSRGFKMHSKPKVSKSHQDQINKIEALLADMKLSWAYAEGIAKQMFKRDRLQWCNARELSAIIAALAYKQAKQDKNAKA